MSYFIPSTYMEDDLTYMSRFNVCRLGNSIYVNEILSAGYIPHICKHLCDHTRKRKFEQGFKRCILLFYSRRSYLILTKVMVLVVQMAMTIYKTLWFYIRLFCLIEMRITLWGIYVLLPSTFAKIFKTGKEKKNNLLWSLLKCLKICWKSCIIFHWQS